jgi:hypothetical protein
MAKDFTDFIIWIYDSGERIVHYKHLRNRLELKNGKRTSIIQGKTYPYEGNKYVLDLDRGYLIRWAPWKKWRLEKPYLKNLVWTFRELTRSKKIGLLFYQEPCHHQCSKCPIADKDCTKLPDKIEPLHISHIHQPTGVMRP